MPLDPEEERFMRYELESCLVATLLLLSHAQESADEIMNDSSLVSIARGNVQDALSVVKSIKPFEET